MASEHETFIQKLVALGVHLEHPDAKALYNRVMGVVEAAASSTLAEFPKMLYHASDRPGKPNQRVVNSTEEEVEAKLAGFDIHPSLRPKDASESHEPAIPPTV